MGDTMLSMKTEKTIIVVRHGALDNPNEIVYNRDSVMDPEDIIHLSDEGERQIKHLSSLLEERGFRLLLIYSSPSIRAQESAKILKGQLKNEDEIVIVEDLDDFFSPGPYKEGMKMDKLEEIGGNTYGKYWRDKYGHESPEEVTSRMQRVFWEIVGNLPLTGAVALVSHGDAIAWLVNSLDPHQNPTPENLREHHYPAKGEAAIITIGEDCEVKKIEFLKQSTSSVY